MSKWSRKAIELFPDLRNEIQHGKATIYTAFFELLPRYRQAHRSHNNAAGVAFYEHLVDYPETREHMHQWILLEIFEDIAGLLEYIMGQQQFAELRKQFKYV